MIKSGRSEMVESTGRYSGTTVVRSTAEKVLKNHGKNNGTGKFDAFVNKMHSMYKATLLDQDQLEDVMEREYKKMYESADPRINEARTSFSSAKYPIRWKANGHEFEVVRPEIGRFGLRIDGEGMLSATSLYDINNYLSKYKLGTQLPNTVTESANPMNESATHYVSGKTSDPTLETSDPAKAVEHWFKICRKAKMMASIHTMKEADGIKLLKWVASNPDKVTTWHKKYNCPYNLDYILDKSRQVADSGRIAGFVDTSDWATEPWEGDMIAVFSAG